MKTYFRLLSFARPIEKFAIPYIITTIFSVIFSTLNLALLAPLLQTLFSKQTTQIVKLGPKPHFFDIMLLPSIIMCSLCLINTEREGTLQFVCGTIVVSALLANLFRSLSQRTMENLRVHTLLNFRRGGIQQCYEPAFRFF